MKNKALLVLSVSLALTGCIEEDKDDGRSGEALGWGASDGQSYNEIEKRINAVPALTRKSLSQDNGEYIDRSSNSMADCTARPAYTSEHFEVAAENDSVPLSDMQRIAAIAEVSLEMIADHLNRQPAELIKHSHLDQLGICLKQGRGTTAGGHGSELTAYQSNNHGGVYEFSLLKHELAHLIDSQMNGNQRAYNMVPGWFVEGMAEVIAGAQPMSAKNWNAKHEKYNNNMVGYYSDNLGGYDDYDLFSTTIHYLSEKGWGAGFVEEFFLMDRWHIDGKPTQYSCDSFAYDNVNYTGDCTSPPDTDKAFIARFNEISAKANGEVTSFDQFQQIYATAIANWLSSR